jgi:hypothetical protein
MFEKLEKFIGVPPRRTLCDDVCWLDEPERFHSVGDFFLLRNIDLSPNAPRGDSMPTNFTDIIRSYIPTELGSPHYP